MRPLTRRRSRLRLLVTLGLLALSVGVLWRFAGARIAHAVEAAPAAAPSTGASPPHPTLTITAARVQRADWPVTLDASGSVAPWMEASIGARISGLPLVDVLVNVGDRVRKGQLLARYDDATVRSELDQLEAALAQAEAGATQARVNRDRALRIRDSGALSEQDVLQYETQAATSDAQVAQARAQLAAARQRLDFTRVLAPDDGMISVRTATLGSIGQPGGAELFRLIRQERLEWRPELPAEQLATLRPGQRAHVQLPDGTRAEGRVRQLGAGLDPNSRLGLAYVDLAPGSRALPAMYLSGTLEFPSRPALVMPAASVVIRDGRNFVALVEQGHARMVPIVPGRHRDGQVELLEGVKIGDTVAVQGAGFLNDNDLVQVVASAATEARRAAGSPGAAPAGRAP